VRVFIFCGSHWNFFFYTRLCKVTYLTMIIIQTIFDVGVTVVTPPNWIFLKHKNYYLSPQVCFPFSVKLELVQ
jgi:hypothetical protein